MASEGPNYPSSYTQGTSGYAWTNPGNTLASDNSRGSVSRSDWDVWYSRVLDYDGFSFAIPAGATIDGVVAEFEGYGSIKLNWQARLIKGGTASGTTYEKDIPGSEAQTSFGSSSDLWGNTLTATDVNAATFGVRLRVKHLSEGFAGRTAYCDAVRLTVHYTSGANEVAAAQTLSLHSQAATLGHGSIDFSAAQSLSSPLQSVTSNVEVDAAITQTLSLHSQAATLQSVSGTVTAQTLSLHSQAAAASVEVEIAAAQTLSLHSQAATLQSISGVAAAQALSLHSQAASLSHVSVGSVVAAQTLSLTTTTANVDVENALAAGQVHAAANQAAALQKFSGVSAAQTIAITQQAVSLGVDVAIAAAQTIAIAEHAASLASTVALQAAQTITAANQAAQFSIVVDIAIPGRLQASATPSLEAEVGHENTLQAEASQFSLEAEDDSHPI